CMQSIEYPWTF
nr:immunoglobulin light chain junction region [Macaca mulatta]MOW40985.1 immunoglobulin light chain junction region [Macaca mulatta]MOW41323.1 immunoglobulin light chain junction region [Macaca mulatta]MOW41377.1 immunoglobulin light chain junction region [Macaca mulatta]MOW41755.1 immunoglobulin light chain junction region [Macaca mulatta]